MFAQLVLTAVCFAASPLEEPASTATGDAERSSVESVDVQYCRAQLQLAETNLQRLRKMNRRVPRTVPSTLIAERQDDVATAQVRLRQAEAGARGNEFSAWLRRARADFSEAETTWKKALAVNRRSAGTIDAIDVKRFRLRAEVYRLQYRRGLALADAPREAQLGWRVELLANELERVKQDATRIAPAARYYYYSFPAWW